MLGSILFDTNWNDLPNEIKVIIIGNLGNNCRLSLRACSRHDKKLVEKVPFRTIHQIMIHNKIHRLSITIMRTVNSPEVVLNFATFADLQKKLTSELEKTDYIFEMGISQTNKLNFLELSTRDRLVKVGKLSIHQKNHAVSDTLKQIDPLHLKKIEIQQGKEEDVYAMPHIKHADLSTNGVNFIQDDQLLKFEGRKIYLEMSELLTPFGIHRFIMKCLSELDTKPVTFRIGYDEKKKSVFDGLNIGQRTLKDGKGEVVVNSVSNKFQLVISCYDGLVEGKTREVKDCQRICRSQKTLKTFNVVQLVSICDNPTGFALTIQKRNISPVSHQFSCQKDLQEKLIAEMSEANYIEKLTIWNTSYNWKFTLDNRQITVGVLCLSDGKNSIDYLNQIEPRHLREILVYDKTDNGEVFSTPQVIQAEKLNWSGCLIRDDQLLEWNAIHFYIDSDTARNLTFQGINQFLKKRLLILDARDLYFYIFISIEGKDTSELFEGLDIRSIEEVPRNGKRYVASSNYPEFQLELVTYEYSFHGKRILKSDLEK